MKELLERALVLSVLISITAISGITAANAETGTVSVSNNVVQTYPGTNIGGVGAASDPGNFSQFKWDYLDYNQPTNFTINFSAGGVTYQNQSNITTFTVTGGGTGSGVFSCSQFLTKCQWVFSPDSRFTTNIITLSYADDISQWLTFTGGANPGKVDANPGSVPTGLGTPPANTPYCVRAANGNCIVDLDGTFVVTYGAGVSAFASVNYNITYPLAGWYNFFVDKSGNTVSTKVIFHSSTNNPLTTASETTFTLTNFSGNAQYTDGLYINLTLQTGQFTNVLINSSGCSGCAVPTPTPTPPPSASGTFVITDKTDYSLFDTATVFWGIDSSIFDFLFNWKVGVIKPDGVEDTIANNVAQTGNIPYQFVQSGTFQFELIKCTIGICLSPSVIATFNANVATPHPYIYAPTTVLANQQFNVTYSYDRNPLSVAEFEFIDVFNARSGVHESSVLTVIDTNNHVVTNFTLPAVAPYVLCLENLVISSELTTCANVNVIAGTIPPTQNIATPLINLTKSTYWFGDTLAGYYQIDNSNYSRNDNATLFWDIFNTDTNVESMYGNIGSQAENFSLLIKNDPEVYRWDNQIVHLPAQFFAGNNQFRIFAKNATATVQIVSAPFSLSNTNAAGWGLSLSKYTVQANEVFQIFITAPGAGSLILNPGATTIPINGTMTLSRAVSNVGLTFIDLYDSSTPSRIQASVILNVTAAPTVTVTTSGQQQASDLANLLTSNLFWALLMTAAFMISVAVAQRGKQEG